ncbi:MAG: ABC transporter permease [Candidatus Heimdallarchaeota archaeon]|nr:MAG: peptide ABC transporter permease [Candidatus Heimdallarchaeota archaeon]
MSEIHSVEETVAPERVSKEYRERFGKIRDFFGGLTNNRVLIYSFRRILTIIPLFIGISIITFALMYMIGDPLSYLIQQNPHITPADIDRIRESLGLNRPPVQQYLVWLWGFVRFDLGLTFFSREPVIQEIGNYLTETLKLQVTQFLISLIISILLGVLAAKFQNTWIDSGVSALALLGLSMPIFVFGNLLIYIFAGRGLNWFPSGKAHSTGIAPINWDALWHGNVGVFLKTFFVYTGDTLWYMVLPVATLVFASLALFTRLVRGSMLEILRQDYILAARANGLSERAVLIGHGLRNALLPVVTYIGLFVGGVLAGAPITETVFSYPGLGNKFVQYINKLDHPLIMAISMIITLMILIANLITDIAYVWVDPRIEL